MAFSQLKSTDVGVVIYSDQRAIENFQILKPHLSPSLDIQNGPLSPTAELRSAAIGLLPNQSQNQQQAEFTKSHSAASQPRSILTPRLKSPWEAAVEEVSEGVEGIVNGGGTAMMGCGLRADGHGRV